MEAPFLQQGKGDRSIAPEATLERVAPFLPRLGITRVGRQTGLDKIGIPVWFASTPNARSIVIAQGKGVTDVDARTSATMEAVERAVASAPSCVRYSSSADDLKASGRKFDFLTSLLAAGKEAPSHRDIIIWATASRLDDRADISVPFDAVHLDHTQTGLNYWQSSDGLASGNTDVEATLHGLFERVERDAYCLWQVTPAPKRYSCLVDPGSLRDSTVNGLVAKIEAADLQLRLFDITSDLDIPCFTALLGPPGVMNRNPVRHVEVTAGSGAHAAPARAAIRAITEAAQSRLTYIAGARDDLLPDLFQRELSLQTRAAFLIEPQDRTYRAAQVAEFDTESLLIWTLDRLIAAKIDRLYTVKLSAPDFPVSVVKVLAPQLENPDGGRRLRYGSRALSRALQ